MPSKFQYYWLNNLDGARKGDGLFAHVEKLRQTRLRKGKGRSTELDDLTLFLPFST